LLEISGFPARGRDEWQYFIANENFPWSPELGRVRADAPVVEHRGWYYIADTSSAPIIEYSRHNFEVRHSHGRVYWAKGFASSNYPSYDLEAFDQWYQRVVRWLRKNGRRISKDPHSVYYFPGAWSQCFERA